MNCLPSLFLLKLKTVLKRRFNLAILVITPLLAMACAWALLTFYQEGGRGIPVGVMDMDGSEFSELLAERFGAHDSVDVSAEAPYAFAGGTPADAAPGGVLDAQVAEAASEPVKRGLYEAVIVLHPGFGEKLRAGDPNGLATVVAPPAGVSRGFVTELFLADLARVYFSCDSGAAALEAYKEKLKAKGERLSAAEAEEKWREAYLTAESYWSPTPLMSVDFLPLPDGGAAEGAPAEGGSARSEAAREVAQADEGSLPALLNAILAKAVSVLFFLYAAFCLMIVSGGLMEEREAGVFLRLRTAPGAAAAWLALSVAVPWLIYGVPCAALSSVLAARGAATGAAAAASGGGAAGALALLAGAAPPLAAFLALAALGALYAFKLDGAGRFRAAVFLTVFASGIARLALVA